MRTHFLSRLRRLQLAKHQARPLETDFGSLLGTFDATFEQLLHARAEGEMVVEGDLRSLSERIRDALPSRQWERRRYRRCSLDGYDDG